MNIDQIAMCYILMGSSQRALQTSEKLFLNFKLVFQIIGRKPKNILNSYINIDQSAMYYISMDLTR